ncbi:hypothetical protein GXB85_00370 [Cellulomonas sp. APG4]|uniref:M15 family metallopeptidase n=1 Tax=Cellulomonas sp. APG4 TaxID=1538656 RepID=UPI00137993B3|nr:hypothetical protein [Cellulomonas sp. APG4]
MQRAERSRLALAALAHARAQDAEALDLAHAAAVAGDAALDLVGVGLWVAGGVTAADLGPRGADADGAEGTDDAEGTDGAEAEGLGGAPAETLDGAVAGTLDGEAAGAGRREDVRAAQDRTADGPGGPVADTDAGADTGADVEAGDGVMTGARTEGEGGSEELDAAVLERLVEARARLDALTAPLTTVAAPVPLSMASPDEALTPAQASTPTSVGEPPVRPLELDAVGLEEAAGEVFALSIAVEEAAQEQADADVVRTSRLVHLEEVVADAVVVAPLVEPGVGGPTPDPASAGPAGTDPWPNGMIPLGELCAPRVAPSALLRCDAAAAFDALTAAYRAAHGTDLVITSSYRSREQQAAARAAHGWLAAPPGRSNHGRGIAVDLAGIGGLGEFDGAAYQWLRRHAPAFGWFHPRAMQPGGSGPPEPWHWEYHGAGG